MLTRAPAYRSRLTLAVRFFGCAWLGFCLAGCGLGSKPTEMTISKDLTEKLDRLPAAY